MVEKINNLLSGITATLIGGMFLILSFTLPKLNIFPSLDPAWVTVIISGIPLLYLAIKRIIYNKGISKISSALLISIAMIAAIIIGDLFAAGEVAFIMAIGAILEDMTTERAKKGLKKLIMLAPTQGRVLIQGKEKLIPAEEIKTNQILRILPGEAIPVDGVIVSGTASVDQSIMTGESLPIDKEVGDEVYCGTLNCFGSIDIKATKIGEDSSLQKLIQMVQNAESNKAPMQRIADKAASLLVPVALLIAIITDFATGDIVRAVTVLVVFCPCALVLATPTAIMAAIGQATKQGVIIKSGEALEKMGKINIIAFDKTGTLTQGKLQVCNIITVDNTITEDMVLSITASVEGKSEHPLGKAIVEYSKKSGIEIHTCQEFKMESGKGVYGIISHKEVYCGNEAFIKENGIILNENMIKTAEQLRQQGKITVFTAQDKKCIGIIALWDTPRPQARQVINSLENMNVDIMLLTGDNGKTADYFARQAGIKQVFSQLLPKQKAEKISQLQKQQKLTCMIGDGINDAPALKTADVGVAMGSMGSDIAIDAADIALMGDDISKIPYLKKLSDETVKTIKFSITLSMCINFVAVALSVLGVLTPTTGALVHNAGSCFVVLIAALLYDKKIKY